MGETPVNLATVGETLTEFATQILMLIGYWIDWLFTEHLLLANIVSAALLLGLADFSIQILETFILGTRTRFDGTRNYRSMQVGMVLGVFNHIWYAFLDSYLHGSGLIVVFKKIALDQAIAGPFFSSAFLVGMGLLEGKSTQEVYQEWSQKFVHIYMVDWMFWPLAQFINFYLVPYRFRVFYVNFATFLWNTFLSFAKHHSQGEMSKHRNGNPDQNSSGVIYHRIPQGGTERNYSTTRSSRKFWMSPSKSTSRSLKVTRRKHDYYTSAKRRSAKLKYRSRSISSSEVQLLSDIKQLLRPLQGRSSTINSILSVKQHLPGLEVYPVHSGLRTRVEELQEDSWTTEDCANCSPSWTGGSSNSGSSINTRLNAATTTNTAICLPDRSQSTRSPIIPRLRKLGAFTAANTTKTSCVQSIAARRKPEITRAPLSLRNDISTSNKHENIAARGDIAKKSWAPQSKEAATFARKPLRHRSATPTTPQFQEEVRNALKNLESLIVKEQKELKDGLAETKAQVKCLQELCAVTYVSVDDGTRDLALKADQLAAWVQMERNLDIGNIRTIIKEVLATQAL